MVSSKVAQSSVLAKTHYYFNITMKFDWRTNLPEENLKSLLSLAEPSLVSHCTATTPVTVVSSTSVVSTVPLEVGVIGELLLEVPF